MAALARAETARAPLARVTAVRLGRYRRPFDAEREVNWVGSAVDLSAADVVLTGAEGLAALDPLYAAFITALSARTSAKLEYQTYKQLCGEFHAASAFGFSLAVELVRRGARGVILYTLSVRGAKAVCCLQPP